MKIRKIIKNCLPYGLVSRILILKSSGPVDFMRQFFKYIDDKESWVRFDDGSKFKNIIDVQGFGWSGSSAALDLLCEYDSVEAMGLIDIGSQEDHRVFDYEIELCRTAGGLFEIEKYIGKISVNVNDALLHRVVLALSSSPIYRKHKELRPYFYEFLSQISFVFSRNNNKNYFNGHLAYNGNNYMCYLKKMTTDDYHQIASKFANTLFNKLFKDSDKCYLVLDQICGDDQRDMDFYRNYFPNLKSIFVYRDPRDIFYDAKHFKVGWIPHEKVEAFISWYKYCMQTFSIDGDVDYLVVRFEDLIIDYSKQVDRIEKYVGLSPSQHLYPKKCLDVTVSRKNIGLWKSDTEFADSYNKIRKELSEICYDK